MIKITSFGVLAKIILNFPYILLDFSNTDFYGLFLFFFLFVMQQLAMDWGEQPFLEKHASRNVFDWDLDFLVILAHNCQCMSNSQVIIFFPTSASSAPILRGVQNWSVSGFVNKIMEKKRKGAAIKLAEILPSPSVTVSRFIFLWFSWNANCIRGISKFWLLGQRCQGAKGRYAELL